MTKHKPFLVEISNINIFHITQFFLVKTYKRDQWNLSNILAYISGIFDGFFKAGLVPLKWFAQMAFTQMSLAQVSQTQHAVRLRIWKVLTQYVF